VCGVRWYGGGEGEEEVYYRGCEIRKEVDTTDKRCKWCGDDGKTG
jgi:hypothetical protein